MMQWMTRIRADAPTSWSVRYSDLPNDWSVELVPNLLACDVYMSVADIPWNNLLLFNNKPFYVQIQSNEGLIDLNFSFPSLLRADVVNNEQNSSVEYYVNRTLWANSSYPTQYTIQSYDDTFTNPLSKDIPADAWRFIYGGFVDDMYSISLTMSLGIPDSIVMEAIDRKSVV